MADVAAALGTGALTADAVALEARKGPDADHPHTAEARPEGPEPPTVTSLTARQLARRPAETRRRWPPTTRCCGTLGPHRPSQKRTTVTAQPLMTEPAWAERVAVAEITRDVSTANPFTYRANSIRQKSRLSAVDERVCPACITNENAAPIPLKQEFLSGHAAPPGHPSCRCASCLPEAASG
ncbi:hypothetical protein [Streptomyces sp. Tue6028]|uniref:hypothetical protein n=1 Tax=Streptomyces sp. Tue6028 TaxID=2036037 RepID=UPI003D708B5E